MKNTQVEQNDQKKQTTMESRIEKSIDAKMEKIQAHLDTKLNQMINTIQPRAKTINDQNSKNSNSTSVIPLIPRQYKDHNTSKNTSTSNSWAQVVSRNTTKSVKMHEKKDFAKSAKSDAWLSRRMIARPKIQISNINPVEYRNKINNALKMHQKFDVLIQTVQLSRTGQHIVFTTIENSNAQKLIEYRNAWENLFEFDEIKVDKKWHEAIVHGIEIEAFKSSNRMQQLQGEIEQWNSIRLTREPMWLTKHENQINKRYSSIKISFSSRNDLKNAIEKGMIVAGTQCKTVDLSAQNLKHNATNVKNLDIQQTHATY